MFKLRKILMILLVTIILVAGTGFSASTAQAASCSSYHVVRPGESLSGIARYYGAYWPYLAQINGIHPPRYTVYPGQVLCIAYGGTGYYPYNGYNNGYWIFRDWRQAVYNFRHLLELLGCQCAAGCQRHDQHQ